jgi:two-component system response regulator HydG
MRRVGSNKDIDLDVRIIVASNEKLWDAARKGKFREDLYHRFNEFSIDVPPLRERTGDIMRYAEHFLKSTVGELDKNITGFSPEVEEIFNNYIWHGNLRELRNVVKRAALLSEGSVIEARSLPFEITNYHRLQFDGGADTPAPAPVPVAFRPSVDAVATNIPPQPVNYENKLKSANIDAEYEVILDALKQSNFNKSLAAKLLNIDRKTLYNKMKQYKAFKLD